MFGTLGGQEIFFILILALIIFGPKKLPEIGKSIGRMMAEFRKASNDFRRTLEEEVEADKARTVEPPPSVTPPLERTVAAEPPASAGPEPSTAPGASSEGPEAPTAPPVESAVVPRTDAPAGGRPDARPLEPH